MTQKVILAYAKTLFPFRKTILQLFRLKTVLYCNGNAPNLLPNVYQRRIIKLSLNSCTSHVVVMYPKGHMKQIKRRSSNLTLSINQ